MESRIKHFGLNANWQGMRYTKGLYIFGFFLSAFCFSTQLVAKHIVGGDMTYICLGVDTVSNRVTFEITLTMYRDCFQDGQTLTPYDPSARIGIHRGSGNNWKFVDEINPGIVENEVPIEPEDNPCVTYPPNLCVDRGVYIFSLSLAIIDESYLLSYQRCCRNNSINNILTPGSTGAAFSIEITPLSQTSCNNSPVFNEFPPILICNGFDLSFDHSAQDQDFDQLVYEFCAPLAAGGPDVNNSNLCTGTVPDPRACIPPYDQVRYVLPTYSATQPITGNPGLTLNPQTGLISGRPNLEGQFVVGVCVKEFRDGVLIGTVRRDFQFNVTRCEPNVFASLKSDQVLDQKEFLLNSCGINTITFENDSYSEEFISSYNWEFNVDGQLQTAVTRNATIEFPGVGEYQGIMVLNKGLECADTATIFVNIFPSIEADFVFEYDTCVAGEVVFLDQSSTGAETLTDWIWDFGENNSGTGSQISYQFPNPGLKQVRLVVEDSNLCEDEMIKTVDWRPVPPLVVIEPSVFVGCEPGDVFFNNLSVPIDSTYLIEWDFGDGKTGQDISPTHTYEESGVFSVNVDITSPLGCKTSRFYPNWIRIDEKPFANFSYSPDNPNNFNSTIQFVDDSQNAISWQWNFNGNSNAFERNPNFTFQDTGKHIVELVVLHPSGCTDTMIQIIDIEPIVDYIMPNAFTPNGDSKNDLFVGTGFLDGIQSFSMSIFNRWGERIFLTEDPSEGWNGRIANSGEVLPGDIYVYLITFIGPRGDKKELKGFATLVR